MAIFNPKCKDCKERYSGCHDHCESFLKAKAEYEELKGLIKKEEELRKHAVTKCFKRRDEICKRKKRCSGYSSLKGLH